MLQGVTVNVSFDDRFGHPHFCKLSAEWWISPFWRVEFEWLVCSSTAMQTVCRMVIFIILTIDLVNHSNADCLQKGEFDYFDDWFSHSNAKCWQNGELSLFRRLIWSPTAGHTVYRKQKCVHRVVNPEVNREICMLFCHGSIGFWPKSIMCYIVTFTPNHRLLFYRQYRPDTSGVSSTSSPEVTPQSTPAPSVLGEVEQSEVETEPAMTNFETMSIGSASSIRKPGWYSGLEFKDFILGFHQCTFLCRPNTLRCIETFHKVCHSIHKI